MLNLSQIIRWFIGGKRGRNEPMKHFLSFLYSSSSFSLTHSNTDVGQLKFYGSSAVIKPSWWKKNKQSLLNWLYGRQPPGKLRLYRHVVTLQVRRVAKTRVNLPRRLHPCKKNKWSLFRSSGHTSDLKSIVCVMVWMWESFSDVSFVFYTDRCCWWKVRSSRQLHVCGNKRLKLISVKSSSFLVKQVERWRVGAADGAASRRQATSVHINTQNTWSKVVCLFCSSLSGFFTQTHSEEQNWLFLQKVYLFLNTFKVFKHEQTCLL